jgi:hypothetical protein
VTAAAETAKAMVQARFMVALHRPRNIDESRIKMLATCRRPRFAEAAQYRKPIGDRHVEGPSIRFADEAVKIFGNIDTRQEVIYEDDEQRIVQVSVTDLETNLTKAGTICIKKIIERKTVRRGQEVIGNRENTKGETVYLIKASDDELVTKEANLCAKQRRNLELQLIPQDIIEECMDEAVETMRQRDAQDPDAARKRLIDSFAAIGVMPSDLEAYLGHGTGMCTPAETQTLREVYAAIRDGHATWAEVMEAAGKKTNAPEKGKVNLDEIKAGDPAGHRAVDAKLASKSAPAPEPAPEPAQEPAPSQPATPKAAPARPLSASERIEAADAEAEALLAANEYVVNQYLVHIEYIKPGQTWRDLQNTKKVKVYSHPRDYVENAIAYAQSQSQADTPADAEWAYDGAQAPARKARK